MFEMTTADVQANEGQGTRVIQVTNVAKTATFEQLKTFFEFLGEIELLKVFPSQDLTTYGSKVCYVKYQDESSVHVAQHLTNTVFIDRALIVVPLGDGIIPEEQQALLMVTSAAAVVGNYAGGLLPVGIPGIVQTVIGSVMPVVSMQLTVPQPPILPDVDPVKLDEIRRTVHIRHLPKDITAEQLMSFFSACGEIRYVRIAGNEEDPTGYAFIEFNEASCVPRALQYCGALFGGAPLKVGYSKHAIVKPEKEIARTKSLLDKTMKKVTEATKLVSEELDDDKTKSRKSSRSRSPSRGKRSRSRSPARSVRRRSRDRFRDRVARRRSPSRERFRGGRVSRVSKSRSRSPSPSASARRRSHRSGSRSRRKLRSTSRNRKSRTPSRDRKRRRSSSRGRSKDTTSRRRSRDRGKDRSKERLKKKGEKKEEPKSPDKRKEDEEEKREGEDEERKEEVKESSKKKSEKTRSQSRSRSKSRQREKKRSREKSASRSPSRSPKRSASTLKHKKRKERRDKGSTQRASDDENESKKREKGSDEEQQKPNRGDESDDERKKVSRRRSDEGAGSEPEENKKKKRHYKKKPISADHYDSDSN